AALILSGSFSSTAAPRFAIVRGNDTTASTLNSTSNGNLGKSANATLTVRSNLASGLVTTLVGDNWDEFDPPPGPALLADFDENHVVDGRDAVIWRKNWG